uniref:NADH-ubiquinone oxidoreductase chain 6 n=1 Tax=Narcine entemedor TaxID=1213697 RepID=A0A0U1XJ01_NAREN|nr:NADH dehydrogenase subunit 6 [Narcine entemedor]AIT70286.1 NADH dehydrogenase subunit 6 [Narcine entemedor]
MTYLILMLIASFVFGFMAVASNPSPYYAALGLVISSGFGCGLLVIFGSSFLSLVLFLIYLGGMLVVFAYSAALAAEPYPETWVDWSVMVYLMFYVILVYISGKGLVSDWGFGWFNEEIHVLDVVRGDFTGVSMLYFYGGYMLILGGWMLLLTLFVVLELTRGLSWGNLRVV